MDVPHMYVLFRMRYIPLPRLRMGFGGKVAVGPGAADPESRSEQLRLGIDTLQFIVMRQRVRVRSRRLVDVSLHSFSGRETSRRAARIGVFERRIWGRLRTLVFGRIRIQYLVVMKIVSCIAAEGSGGNTQVALELSNQRRDGHLASSWIDEPTGPATCLSPARALGAHSTAI